MGHLFDGNHAATVLFVGSCQLFQARRASDQVVGEVDEERFVTYRRLGAQNGMTEAQRLSLANVNAGNAGRDNAPDGLEQIRLAGVCQRPFQLGIGVEMVLDRSLGRTGHEYKLRCTGSNGFLHRVLDKRLVDNGQHFFGTGFGCRQESGSSACDWKYGGSYGIRHFWLQRSKIVERGRIIANIRVRKTCGLSQYGL
jgi:hypothetical protein